MKLPAGVENPKALVERMIAAGLVRPPAPRKESDAALYMRVRRKGKAKR